MLAAKSRTGLQIAGAACLLLVYCLFPGGSAAADQVDVSMNNACATIDAQAWCWGDNSNGATGHEDFESWFDPRRVTGLQSDVAMVETNGVAGCAIVAGAVKCWGWNLRGQLGKETYPWASRTNPETVTGIASGATDLSVNGRSACAVISDGIKCWGSGEKGVLGDGIDHVSPNQNVYVPVDVAGLGTGSVATKVSTGGYGGTTCAVVDGAAKCWGSDDRELLGNGTGGDSLSPATVNGLSSGVTDISMGSERACAVKDSKVYCWGGRHGEFGYDEVAVEVAGFGTGATQVTTGYDFDCAVVDGATKCVGVGRLGDGDIHESPGAVTVPELSSGTDSVSATTGIACGIGDALYCWGWPGISDSLDWAIGLSSEPMEYEFDTEPPTVSIDGPTTVTSSQVEFELSADEDVDFKCSLDGGPWVNCGPTYARTYSRSQNGDHEVRLRGVDWAGNDSETVTHAFIVAIPDPPVVSPPSLPAAPSSPAAPVQPMPKRVKAKLSATRGRSLSVTVSVSAAGGLPVAACPHVATIKVRVDRIRITKRVALAFVGSECAGTKTIRLPKSAARKRVSVEAAFGGNALISGYAALLKLKPRR